MGQRGCTVRFAAVLLVLGAAVCLSVAELATVILKDGTRLRGDLTTTDGEVVIRNLAGEVRFAKGDVAEVEWANAPASLDEQYLRRVRLITPDDLDGHFVIAEWARDRERFDLVSRQCTYILGLRPDHANARLLLEFARAKLAEQANGGPQVGPARDERVRPGGRLAEPEKLSDLDVTRLRMYEFPDRNAPRNLRVRFLGQRGKPDVAELVKRELAAANKLDGATREVLERGKPAEQLAAVVAATGVAHAARVEISGDPPVFATFRRKVLPLVQRGCAGSGCHGGDDAAVFRLPNGSSDEHIYTAFLVLDQIPTRFGPLINREAPQRSALLSFMLPRTATDQPHPPTPGERFSPRFRGERDANYVAIHEWIDSLRSPHPVYELDYAGPPWLTELRERAELAEDGAPTSQPSSLPTPDDG